MQYLQTLQSYVTKNKSKSAMVFEKFPGIPATFETFNRQFWVRLVLDVNHDLSSQLQAKLDDLAKWQSRRLSIDHTFRVVKNVVAFVGNDKSRQVCNLCDCAKKHIFNNDNYGY